jgi:hypothetical protein
MLRYQAFQPELAGLPEQVLADLAMFERRDEDPIGTACQQPGEIGFAQAQWQLAQVFTVEREAIEGVKLNLGLMLARMLSGGHPPHQLAASFIMPATTLGRPPVSPGVAGCIAAPAQGSPALLGRGGLSARHPKAAVWRLATGVPRILPLVQFCQIRQAVNRQLLSIALASRREAFNISANFLP